ncbi:MAG: O-antigen ligase family protein [Paenibacillaceae bacterium]
MVAKKAQQTQPRYAFWFLATFIILFLIIAPFNKALFNLSFLQFENPIYYAILYGSIALLVVAISLYFTKKNPLNDPILHILVWLIPLSLFISSLSAVSHSLALNGVYIYLFLAGMFVLARYLTAQTHGHFILTYGLIGTGYIIVIFGFMNWFGDASFFGMKNWSDVPEQVSQVYKDAVQVDSNGPRMASVFQYANAYASYLTGLLFCTLYLMVTANRRLILIISSLMLVPILLSMLLTLSRGGWAAALVSFLIILFFIHIHKQILMLVYSLIGVVVTIVIFNSVNQMGNDLREQFSASTYTLGWLILIVASAFITLIALILHKYAHASIRNKFAKLSPKWWASSIMPILLLFVGVLMGYLVLQDTPINRALPDNLEQRVGNINLNQHSVLERGTFYSDAWKLYKDYPILGAGAGAWSTLYEQYQNNPYTSRLAHSFIMQHLVETGTLGIIIFLAFLILIFYQFITRRRTWNKSDNGDLNPRLPYFLFALPILVHSAIDFDMSFVYIEAVVFLCLGAMTVGYKPIFNIPQQSFIIKWNRIYPITLIILSLIMFIGTIQLLRANKLHNQVITSAPSIQYINDTFDHILQIREGNPYYTLSKSQLLSQLYTQTNDEAYYNDNLELINHTLQYEPYNSELIKLKLELLLSKNKLDQAYTLTKRALTDFPWNVAFYEKNMGLAMLLLENDIKAQDWTHSQQYIQTAISTHQKLNNQIEHLKTLPEGQLQGQPFLTTPIIELTAAKAYYYNNDFETAESILKPLVNAEQLQDPLQREISRWYLASLVRQGQDDPELLSQLASVDSEELTKLQQLTSITIPQ